ncbi:hypothetical protein MIR68_001978 [Amoeboaphelidium protococcarum]|nr:hypothetical protein MIR68_001978 [Amoeboaphelidium protococcarum]KAI3643999.1 hypothetical protein MP228_010163 [Amoeboaphelidium protococcarum]
MQLVVVNIGDSALDQPLRAMWVQSNWDSPCNAFTHIDQLLISTIDSLQVVYKVWTWQFSTTQHVFSSRQYPEQVSPTLVNSLEQSPPILASGIMSKRAGTVRQ